MRLAHAAHHQGTLAPEIPYAGLSPAGARAFAALSGASHAYGCGLRRLPGLFHGLPRRRAVAVPLRCIRPIRSVLRRAHPAAACPKGAFHFSGEHRLAAFRREALRIAPLPSGVSAPASASPCPPRDYSLFRRSLKLRQVSAGGCNACEADCNVLGTLVYDLGRFGIEFTASPRHADGLVVTGPVTENMRRALLDTWAAMPEPRLLVAVGACAISGGLFRESPQCHGGLDGGGRLPPVDVFVPGCPPNPWSILDGLLSLRRRD